MVEKDLVNVPAKTSTSPWDATSLDSGPDLPLVDAAERRQVVRSARETSVHARTSRYELYQRRAYAAGIVGAGLAYMNALAGPKVVVGPIIVPDNLTAGILGGAATVFILSGWTWGALARRYERAALDVDQTLDDRSTYFEVLCEIMGPLRPDDIFPRAAVEIKVNEWITKVTRRTRAMADFVLLFAMPAEPGPKVQALAAALGQRDFVKVLLAKGVERGVLEEAEDFDGTSIVPWYRVSKVRRLQATKP